MRHHFFVYFKVTFFNFVAVLIAIDCKLFDNSVTRKLSNKIEFVGISSSGNQNRLNPLGFFLGDYKLRDDNEK